MGRRLPLPANRGPGARLRGLTAAVLMAAFLAASGPVWAGEEPIPPSASAVQRLTPQELEYLRRQILDWDDLPEERRERIARNVVRLRDLSPEDRERFRERVERFRAEETALRDRVPERLAHLSGQSRERFRLQAALATAVGTDLLRTLPEDVRRAVATAAEGRGGAKPAMLGYAFSRALLEREAESLALGEEALRYAPSDEARPRFEALAARARAAPAEERTREMRVLATFVVEDRVRQAVRPVLLRRGPREDHAADVVAAVRAAFPAAWDATSDDLRETARRGPSELRRFLVRFGPKPERPEKGRHLRGAAFFLVRFLEQAAPWLATSPEARSHADHLVESVLRDGLGVPATALERLPGWDRPGERVRAWKRLLLAR